VPDTVNEATRGFFVLLTDVTPRIEIQRAMDHAQAVAQMGRWDLIPQTGHITWSQAVYTVLGLGPSAEPPESSTVWQHIHPADRQRVEACLEDAVRTGVVLPLRT
jgi:hypothetical protein